MPLLRKTGSFLFPSFSVTVHPFCAHEMLIFRCIKMNVKYSMFRQTSMISLDDVSSKISIFLLPRISCKNSKIPAKKNPFRLIGVDFQISFESVRFQSHSFFKNLHSFIWPISLHLYLETKKFSCRKRLSEKSCTYGRCTVTVVSGLNTNRLQPVVMSFASMSIVCNIVDRIPRKKRLEAESIFIILKDTSTPTSVHGD